MTSGIPPEQSLGIVPPTAETATPVVETGAAAKAESKPLDPELGDPRDATIIKKDTSIEGEKKPFSLEKQTEIRFAGLVQKQFLATESLSTADGLEDWQVQFNTAFRQRIEQAAGPNRRYADITPEERKRLVIAEAARFVADTANLQVAEMISQRTIMTLQRRLKMKIDFIKRATPDKAIDKVGVINDPRGNQTEKYVPDSWVARLVRRVKNATPIKTPVAYDAHLSPSERATEAITSQQENLDESRDKLARFKVTFDDPSVLALNLAGMTNAERALLEQYGINLSSPILSQTVGDEILKTVHDASEARGDFYARTGFDVSKLAVDFRDTWYHQRAHSDIEKQAWKNLTSGGARVTDVEQLRREIGKLAVEQMERRTVEEVEERKRTKQAEIDNGVVENSIVDLGKPKSKEAVEIEREKLQAERNAEAERLEEAENKEALEKEKKKLQKEATEAERAYSSDDLVQYEKWLKEVGDLDVSIVDLTAEQSFYQGVFDDISAENTRLKEHVASLQSIRTTSGNQGNRPVTADDQTAAGKQIEQLRTLISNSQDEIGRLKENVLDPDGKKITWDQVTQRGRLINSQLARAKARKAIRTAEERPAGWDETKLTTVSAWKEKKDRIEVIDRIVKSIPAGTESVGTIQRKLAALDKRISNVENADGINLHRKEAYVALKKYMQSDQARRTFLENQILLREGTLAHLEIKFYENWPPAHIRIIQGLFGDEVFNSPSSIAEISRIITPEKAMQLYSALHPGVIVNEDSFAALTVGDISAADVRSMWETLYGEAVKTRTLAKIDDEEEKFISTITSFKPDMFMPQPPPEQVAKLEKSLYYYRDLADLQLRILQKWAETHPDPSVLFDPVAGEMFIQSAAIYAKAVDEQRKKRQYQVFGNPTFVASADNSKVTSDKVPDVAGVTATT